MISAEFGICALLGIAVCERTAAGTFCARKPLPDWWPLLADGHDLKMSDSQETEFSISENGGFLDHFLVDAEIHWGTRSSVPVHSGPWELVPGDGTAIESPIFEATALTVDGKHLLLIRNADLLGGKLQQVLQQSRERHLATEKEIDEQQRLARQLLIAKEAAEDFTRSKSQFLANMSHEVRTPLAGIMGMTSLALNTEGLPSEVRGYLTSAMESSESLLRIVNDILDFSRVESGKLQLQLGPVSVRDLLAQVHDHFDFHAREKNLQLCIQWSTTTPDIIRSDAVRLRQILFNLAENALKFTPQGEVRVSAHGTTDCKKVQFAISDTGIGISEEDQGKIFEAFAQVDPTMTRRHGGTGLGLSIVHSLTELLGGHLDLKSNLGDGTTFRLTFPISGPGDFADSDTKEDPLGADDVILAEPEGHDPSSRDSSPNRTEAPKVHVLIAEDNIINQQFLRRSLERMGYRVTAVETGTDVVQQWGALDVDLILMDCRMPDMDGFEATEEIRRRENERGVLVGVPIIALTAHALGGFKKRCLNHGMDDYLAKPFRLSELEEILQRHTATNKVSPSER